MTFLFIIVFIALFGGVCSSERGFGLFRRSSALSKLSVTSTQLCTDVREDEFVSIVANVRQKHFLEFKSSIDGVSVLTEDVCNMNKVLVLTKCRAAMKTIANQDRFPQHSIEDALLDLETDIDEFIESRLKSTIVKEIPSISSFAVKMKEFFATTRGKRVRWFLAQSLLLVINFAQNEWAQHISRRAVDRRLAEIPEFPLL